MEAVGIALSTAQTLFTALQCWQLKEMCSIFGKESELVEFQNIVDTVKAVLLDADKKDNIPDKKTQLYIQQLKDAVYDADDLLDDFVTIAEQIQQMKGGKASEKLHHFFSSRNPLAAAFNVSRGVKKIRKNLDVIASNHSNFRLSVHSNFSVDSQPTSFQKIGLSNSRDSQKNIMPILELSYHQLESPLKTCFTYCALFPKDFVIKKELLICLWMAQGFIVPLDEGQKVQDAAEEYFSILLRRCFFQEVECDDYGGILACKIHDLMHDMAQKLAGKEVCVTNSVVNNVGEKVRHLALVRGRCAQHSFTKNHIRSYLFVGGRSVDTKMQQHYVEALISKWVCLRALDLSESGLNSLPDSIGELLHLRFLDLSRNYYLKVLPKSFTKLCNLETLILTRCLSLIELPKDLRKLVKLRVLDIKQCNRLTSMPRGIGKLSCLDTLSRFLVSLPSWKQLFDDVEELKDLRNLRGALSMEITFPNKCNDPEVDGGDKMEGAYLTKKQHLNVITFQFSGKADADEEALRLIEELQPHSNLKGLELCGFIGARMPSWARGHNLTAFLPNLIRLQLSNLSIKYVTCLGNLLHLKSLKIEFLSELENIIEYSEPTTSTSTIAAVGLTMATTEGLSSSLFPSLERLELIFLPKLKGWGRSRMGDWVEDEGELIHDNNRSMEPLLLPHLKTLRIKSCPNLESTMLCPFLEELNLQKYNKKTLDIVRPSSLALSKEIEIKKVEALSLSCFSSGTSWKTKIRDVELLKSLPMESIPSLDHMHIVEDNDACGEFGRSWGGDL